MTSMRNISMLRTYVPFFGCAGIWLICYFISITWLSSDRTTVVHFKNCYLYLFLASRFDGSEVRPGFQRPVVRNFWITEIHSLCESPYKNKLSCKGIELTLFRSSSDGSGKAVFLNTKAYGFSVTAILSGVCLLLTLRLIFTGYVRHKRLRHGLCIQCGYSLFCLPTARCPECGTPFERKELDPPGQAAQ